MPDSPVAIFKSGGYKPFDKDDRDHLMQQAFLNRDVRADDIWWSGSGNVATKIIVPFQGRVRQFTNSDLASNTTVQTPAVFTFPKYGFLYMKVRGCLINLNALDAGTADLDGVMFTIEGAWARRGANIVLANGADFDAAGSTNNPIVTETGNSAMATSLTAALAIVNANTTTGVDSHLALEITYDPGSSNIHAFKVDAQCTELTYRFREDDPGRHANLSGLA